jgi:hypothetical protein
VTTQTLQRSPVWPYGLASGLVCGIAVAAALALKSTPALFGAGAAALGALCALGALPTGVRSGTNGVLAAFTVGFLARALLVAAGLFASGARGDAALSYVFTFFALYAATQAIEILYVRASTSSRQP